MLYTIVVIKKLAWVWLSQEVVYRHLKQNAEELRTHDLQAEIKRHRRLFWGKTFLETHRKLLLNLWANAGQKRSTEWQLSASGAMPASELCDCQKRSAVEPPRPQTRARPTPTLFTPPFRTLISELQSLNCNPFTRPSLASCSEHPSSRGWWDDCSSETWEKEEGMRTFSWWKKWWVHLWFLSSNVWKTVNKR